jgi:ABC-type amino acid transport substrate-binding protein
MAQREHGPNRRRLLRLLPGLPLLDLLGGMLPARASEPAALRLITLHLPPFGMIDAQGHPTGINPDLAALLTRESGIALESVMVPYPRATAMMASGEGDLLISIGNSHLAALVRPLAHVFNGEVVVIGRPGLRLNSLEDLHGKVVGHIRGAEYLPAFDNDSAIRKHETMSYQQSVQMLLEGRYDAMIGFRPAIFYTLRSLGKPRSALGQALRVGEREVALFMSRKAARQDAAEPLARAMNALRERGAVKAVLERYFGE